MQLSEWFTYIMPDIWILEIILSFYLDDYKWYYRKVMTNLDSILKSRDITLPTKVCLARAMVFPVVMYGCESWTVKKAKCRRIDAFELWCWRRFLLVPWTARRSNQSILKETSPGCSLEGLIVRLKLQYFGQLMRRVDSLEKTLMQGGIGGRRRRGREDGMAGWHHRLDGHGFGWSPGVGDGQGADNAGDTRDSGSIPGWGRSTGRGNGNSLQYSCLENYMHNEAWWAAVQAWWAAIHRVAESDTTEQLSIHCYCWAFSVSLSPPPPHTHTLCPPSPSPSLTVISITKCSAGVIHHWKYTLVTDNLVYVLEQMHSYRQFISCNQEVFV